MTERVISTLDLNLEEQEHVRNALSFLHVRVEGWKPLGKILHYDHSTLIHIMSGRRGVTASLAMRIAKLVGVKIDDLLAGRYPALGVCPRCGYHDTRDANRTLTKADP